MENNVNTNVNKIAKYFTLIVLLGSIFISLILGLSVSGKCGWLFYGVFNLLMYTHLTTTRICNTFIGRDGSVDDTFWKMFFMLLGGVGLSIGICL